MLLKQKEDRIQELERLLHQENSNSNEQMKLKMSQFQKDFESLNLQHQTKITEKQTQLEAAMTRLQSQPQLEQFIKEALDVNVIFPISDG